MAREEPRFAIGYSPRRVSTPPHNQPRSGFALFELWNRLRTRRLGMAAHVPGLRRRELPQPSAGRGRPPGRLRQPRFRSRRDHSDHRPRARGVALPGGFVDHREDWRDAVVRELKEETGIEAASRDVRLADAMSSPDGHLLLFGLLPERPAAELPEPAVTDETEGWHLLRRPTELAFPSTPWPSAPGSRAATCDNPPHEPPSPLNAQSPRTRTGYAGSAGPPSSCRSTTTLPPLHREV